MLLNNYNPSKYHSFCSYYPSETPINSPESRWMCMFDRLQIKYYYAPQIDLPDGTLFSFSKFYLPELNIWVGVGKEFSKQEKEKLKYLYNSYISKDIIIVDDISKDIFANLSDKFFYESKLVKESTNHDSIINYYGYGYEIFDILFLGSIYSLKFINNVTHNKVERNKIFISFSDHSGFSSVYNSTYKYWVYKFSLNNFSISKTNKYDHSNIYYNKLREYSQIRHYLAINGYDNFKIYIANFIDYISNNKIKSSDFNKYPYCKVKCGKNKEYSLVYIEKINYNWKSFPIFQDYNY